MKSLIQAGSRRKFGALALLLSVALPLLASVVVILPPPFTPPAPTLTAVGLSGAQFHLVLSGSTGRYYQIQWSADMIVWVPLNTLYAAFPSNDFYDNLTGTDGHRYYRALDVTPSGGLP